MTKLINKEWGILEYNNIPITRSRKVAEIFDKNHFHVLRDIVKLTESKSGLSKSFANKNFIFNEYKDSTGRKLPNI
jgi:phage regulator Rha-like protein